VLGFESPNDEPWAALATTYLGLATAMAGDPDRGLTLAEDGLARQRAIGEEWALANTFVIVGDLLAARGEHARAAAIFVEAAAALTEQRDYAVIFWPLLGLLNVMLALGHGAAPARLSGVLATLCDRAGVTLWPYFADRRDAAAVAARAALGDESFERERAAGRAFPLDQVLAEAAAMVATLTPTAATSA
jgi:hypothetical protein